MVTPIKNTYSKQYLLPNFDSICQSFRVHNLLLSLLFKKIYYFQYADAACMALCNISRPEENLEKCVKILYPRLSQIMDAFTNTNYNECGANLHYLGMYYVKRGEGSLKS